MENSGNQPLHQIRNPFEIVSPVSPPSPATPNAGTRILALVNPQTPPSSSASSFLSGGACLSGDFVSYDVDDPERTSHQLEFFPITKYNSDPELLIGRRIASNRSYICYGLKDGNIRVLNSTTCSIGLLSGHVKRVVDMVFWASHAQRLASVSKDGRVLVWEIKEKEKEDLVFGITGDAVVAIQFYGEEDYLHPRLCWHCDKNDVLFVGIGNCVLSIHTTKIRKVKGFSDEAPIRCFVDALSDGVHLIGKHGGEVTDLSMCKWPRTCLASASADGTVKIWETDKAAALTVLKPHDGQPVYSASFFSAPHHPPHTVLITGGPQNQELKIWVSESEYCPMLFYAQSWKCTQTLELKSSAEPQLDEVFFNQVVPLPSVCLFVIANAKRNSIYVVHLEYGANPKLTRMNYITEFHVSLPILSITGMANFHTEQLAELYCIQTQVIQKYNLDLYQCFPPAIQSRSSDFTTALRHTASPQTPAVTAPLPNSPGLSTNIAGFGNMTISEQGQSKSEYGKGQRVIDFPVSRQMVTNQENLSNASSSDAINDVDFQIKAVPNKLNQLMIMQREIQTQMSSLISAAIVEERRRLEAAQGQAFDKAIKANTEALWARLQEENVKHERLRGEFTQKILSSIKELTSLVENDVKKELVAIEPSIVHVINSSIEKTISETIFESFQRGVGDKVVDQLEKSVSSKLEASVGRQIQVQFQNSGKKALKDALKSNLEASLIPAFEKSCQAMFDQIYNAFQKGMVERTTASQKHFDCVHSPLAVVLMDSLKSTATMVQSLTQELADGQRKLLSFAATEANPSAVSPQVPQLTIGPFCGSVEQVEATLDPKIELPRLIDEGKYEEAFTSALQRSDLSVVYWLCSKADLHRVLSFTPNPLSQGVLLSLLQQLSCDIDNDSSQKLAWIADVAAAINPSDPVTAPHVIPILEEVKHGLTRQNIFPTIPAAELSSLRVPLCIINNILMSCK